MIVGTAGHIDHGKTTLVRALTGVDTDRLPEEKQRGISIELGYAFLPVAGGGGPRIGFVDVPGHERLVATMLSGASGFDHALVLVAADDGVMPQTREHVAALAMLGVREATLVVTKADRAEPGRIEAVAADARALLDGTPLAGAPVFVVAASQGRGVDALRDHLVARSLDAQGARPRVEAVGARRNGDPPAPVDGVGDAEAVPADGEVAAGATGRSGGSAAEPSIRPAGEAAAGALGFRLAVDRVFTLAGAGTVATGTAHAGRVAPGDTLVPAPDASGLGPVRVRGLHAQSEPVEEARAGQRVAVQLAGVDRAALARGGWLVDPCVALSTDRLDVALTVWRDEPKALRSGATVHVHVGADAVLATAHVLVGETADGVSLAPAARGVVQLVLRRPIGAWRGDRVVLRDAAATRVVGGGTVLDPFAPVRHRRAAERLAELAALALPTTEARLAALLVASPFGVDLDRFRRAEGRLAATTIGARSGVHTDAAGTVALADASVGAWRDRAAAALAVFHRDRPDELGPDAARLRRLAAPRLGDAAWRLVMDAAVASGAIARDHGLLHLPQHAVRLSALERTLAERALPRLLEGGFDPPWVRTLAADLRVPEAQLRAALLRLAQRGELHQVVKDLFYPPATMARAATLVRTIAARDGSVTAATFRDASGLGRKRAIQIVEFFDRAGLLRRVGDEHRLRADCDAFANGPDP